MLITTSYYANLNTVLKEFPIDRCVRASVGYPPNLTHKMFELSSLYPTGNMNLKPFTYEDYVTRVIKKVPKDKLDKMAEFLTGKVIFTFEKEYHREYIGRFFFENYGIPYQEFDESDY